MKDLRTIPFAVATTALLVFAAVQVSSYMPQTSGWSRQSPAAVGGVLAQTDFEMTEGSYPNSFDGYWQTQQETQQLPMWSDPYIQGTFDGYTNSQQIGFDGYAPTEENVPFNECETSDCEPYIADDVYDEYEVYHPDSWTEEYVVYDEYGYPSYNTSYTPWYAPTYTGGTVVQSIIQSAPAIIGSSVPAVSQQRQSAPPSCSITARPASVAYGGSTVLSWVSANATHASLSHVGTVTTSGSRAIPNLAESTEFDLTVAGPAGSNWCRASVYVAPRRDQTAVQSSVTFSAVPIGAPAGGVIQQPEPVYYYQQAPVYGGLVYVQGAPSVRYRIPSCYISTYPQEVNEGEMVNLMWSSTDATSAYLSDVGAVGTAGTTQFTPRNGSYVLSVTGPGGASTCTTNVIVHARVTPVTPSSPSAPTCSISADPASIFTGGSTKLSWKVTRADSVSISGFGSVSAKDSRTVSPEKTQKYTVTAKGEGGTKTCSVAVTVQDPSSCKVICNGVTYACAPVGTPVSPVCPSTDTSYASSTEAQQTGSSTSKGGLWNWIVNLFR